MKYGKHDCYLVDDGTLDTVIRIDGHIERFDGAFVEEYRLDNGELSMEGFEYLVETALDADPDKYDE